MTEEVKFKDVKVGDLIKFVVGGWYSHITIKRVTKVTAARFSTGYYTFRKSDGKLIGGDCFDTCEYATEEDLKKMQVEKETAEVRSQVRTKSSFTSSYRNTQKQAVRRTLTRWE